MLSSHSAWRITRLRGEWCVTWDDAGVDGSIIRRRYRLGTTDRTEAQTRAATRYAALTRPAGRDVKDLWTAYCADKTGKAVLDTMKYTWRALSPVFANIRGEDIVKQHCEDYTALRRAAGKSDGTIHTELGHLRTVLVWARDNKLTTDAPKISRPAKPDPKERYLTKVEARALMDNAKVPHIRLAILLLCQTGARCGAALELTWDRVDFVRDMIKLTNPFDRVARKGRATVPISDQLRAALLEAKEGAMSPFVIEWAGGRVKSIKRGIKAAAKAAGLADVSPHVLRHSVAVWLIEGGASFEEVAQLLRHSDVRLTYKVYARYSPTYLRKLTADLMI
jgi:integrase